MGRQHEAPAAIQSAFNGRTLLPYAFAPASLRDQRVVVVGSGETALEMLMVAARQECRHAHLLIRPDVDVRDAKFYWFYAHCISGSCSSMSSGSRGDGGSRLRI